MVLYLCHRFIFKKAFSEYLAENDITQSFSKVRNPYDNSVAESFFSSLKREELYRRKIKSEYVLKQIICDYIDFYNNRRPQATINYTALFRILYIFDFRLNPFYAPNNKEYKHIHYSNKSKKSFYHLYLSKYSTVHYFHLCIYCYHKN